VDLAVQGVVRLDVAPLEGVLHAGVQGGQLLQALLRDALAGLLAGQGLQRARHGKQAVHLLDRQLPHARSPVGQQFDLAFGSQHLQCLPQGRAGHAEALAELGFRHFLAGRHLAADEDLPQVVEQVVVDEFLGHGAIMNSFFVIHCPLKLGKADIFKD
jgi:hypothetical protein